MGVADPKADGTGMVKNLNSDNTGLFGLSIRTKRNHYSVRSVRVNWAWRIRRRDVGHMPDCENTHSRFPGLLNSTTRHFRWADDQLAETEGTEMR